MYTFSSTAHGFSSLPRPGALLAMALMSAASVARAQVPVPIKGMSVTATAPGPGAHLFAGTVRDTAEFPLEGVEISVPFLKRRTFSDAEGRFRFDGIPVGTYAARARKIGYASQISTIIVDSAGATKNFMLLPFARTLPAVVASAVGGGLSGIVADTAYVGIPGAEVAVLSKDMRVLTDSVGSFFLPAPPGSYMVAIRKDGFMDRLVGVRIPEDSGRRLTAFLHARIGERPHVEAWNIPDLASRMAWRTVSTSRFFTREELKQMGIEWVGEAVEMGYRATASGAIEPLSSDCKVIVDGGPRTADLSTLTVDDIESVEVYGSQHIGAGNYGRGPDRQTFQGGQMPLRLGPAAFDVPLPITNTEKVDSENRSRNCARAYVWMR